MIHPKRLLDDLKRLLRCLEADLRERTTCHRQYSLAVPFTERFFDLVPAVGHQSNRTGPSYLTARQVRLRG